jgi:hypothetical protein
VEGGIKAKVSDSAQKTQMCYNSTVERMDLVREMDVKPYFARTAATNAPKKSDGATDMQRIYSEPSP